jgi:hypothetical protein
MASKPVNLPIPGAPDPTTTPDLYDSFKLQGVWSPGVCHFPSAPKRATGWDIQVPAGTGGGFTILHKIPPIKFSLTIELWKGDGADGEDVDWFLPWLTFKKILTTTIKRNSPHALSFWHPLTAGLDPPCTDVVTELRSEPNPDGTGRGTVEIDFLEYKPLIIRPVARLTGTSTSKSDPNADVKQLVGLATDEFKDPGTLTPAQRQAIGL